MDLKTEEFPRRAIPRSFSSSPVLIREPQHPYRGCVNENTLNSHSKSAEPTAQKCTKRVCRYYGVRFRSDLQKWVAEIRVTEWKAVDKKVWLGTFDSAEAAARASDLARKLLKCRKKRLPNFPCEALTSYSETLPAHLNLRDVDDDCMFKEVNSFVKRKAREYVASLSPNAIFAGDDAKPASFSPMETVPLDKTKAEMCPQVVVDESLAEITAESSPCLETNFRRKRKVATLPHTDESLATDFVTKLAPLINQQIEDVLTSTLLPLVLVLRGREEDEQKHREQMLSLEEQKLALKREKLLLKRRRGANHRTSSHSPHIITARVSSSPKTEPALRSSSTQSVQNFGHDVVC